MNKAKKEGIDMQVSSLPPLPMSKQTKKRLVQAEVSVDLFNAVDREIERDGLTIRQVLEWGFKAYLLVKNPKEAEKLGITDLTVKK